MYLPLYPWSFLPTTQYFMDKKEFFLKERRKRLCVQEHSYIVRTRPFQHDHDPRQPALGGPAWTRGLDQMTSNLSYPVTGWFSQYLKQQLWSHKVTLYSEQTNCIPDLGAVQSPLVANLWWMSLCFEYFPSSTRMISVIPQSGSNPAP